MSLALAVLAAGLLLLALLLAPHIVPRTALSPGPGIALFLSLLALRAAIVSSAAMVALLVVPSTPAFGALSGWCVHAAVPYISAHLGLNGHAVGHAAVLVPASLPIVMLASASVGTGGSASAVGQSASAAAGIPSTTSALPPPIATGSA